MGNRAGSGAQVVRVGQGGGAAGAPRPRPGSSSSSPLRRPVSLVKLAIVIVALAIAGFAAWSVRAQSVKQDQQRYQEEYTKAATDYNAPAPVPPGEDPAADNDGD